MARPPGIFDREQEWHDLARFATAAKTPTLGIVYGRRRQGKSFLLRALAKQEDGIYHQALEEERTAALASLGRTIATDGGLPAPPALGSWEDALRILGGPRRDRLIVLDEFPFLAARSPELPSLIQRVFDEARSDAAAPQLRLLLCGSAMSVMSELLSGSKPLRGRAALQILVEPFDFRTAASFWKIRDPNLAFHVHAIVGGTPGYRDLLSADAPRSPKHLFEWLADGVLDPAHALFTEAEYILAEDPAISDRSLYQSVLSAVVGGAHTQREIGGRLGRTDQSMQHPLAILERAGFVRRDTDVLLARRPLIRVADPMLRFHHAILRPDLARFEARRTKEAWTAAGARFDAQVLGPHFEQLAREWTEQFASPATLGGRPANVGFTAVNDPVLRQRFEVDVVAVAPTPLKAKRPTLLAIGEAKGGTSLRTPADLERLERIRMLLEPRAIVAKARLLLFSRAGFSKDLVAVARRRPDVELVDLERMYGGE